MKREGRQHGMVRTYPTSSAPWDPRPKPQSPSQLNSTRTAGPFAKVSTKPTNHSKFTGKCGRPMCRECHVNPASKSKVKAKGAHRLRSCSGLRFSGFAATSVLNYLDSDVHCYGSDDDEEYDISQVEESNCETSYQFDVEEGVGSEAKKNGINGEDDEEDLSLSFCDVEFVWNWQLEDGDEEWYLV